MLTAEKSLHLTAEDTKLGCQTDLLRLLQLFVTNGYYHPDMQVKVRKVKWISSR